MDWEASTKILTLVFVLQKSPESNANPNVWEQSYGEPTDGSVAIRQLQTTTDC